MKKSISTEPTADETSPKRTKANTSLKPISDLISQYETLTPQLSQFVGFRAELQEWVDNAIRDGQPDDAELLAKISDNRIKLEILPTKIAQTQNQIDGVAASLNNALEDLRQNFELLRPEIRRRIVAALDSALAPIVGDAASRLALIDGAGFRGAASMSDEMMSFERMVACLNKTMTAIAFANGNIVTHARYIVATLDGFPAAQK